MVSDREQRVLYHLRRMIQQEHYLSGSRLPTERQLAAELSVGRGPVRRALAALEAEGKISRHVGKGTFVGNAPGPRRRQPSGLSLTQSGPEDIIETRLTIEPRVAAMAAVRASH